MESPPPIPAGAELGRYSLSQFVEKTAQRDRGQGLFELETQRMLEVNLNGSVWTKMGSMVAYRGNVKFTREGVLEQGIGNLLKKQSAAKAHASRKRKDLAKYTSRTQGRRSSLSVSRMKRSSSMETTCWHSRHRSRIRSR